jgi:hypothetical protein
MTSESIAELTKLESAVAKQEAAIAAAFPAKETGISMAGVSILKKAFGFTKVRGKQA